MYAENAHVQILRSKNANVQILSVFKNDEKLLAFLCRRKCGRKQMKTYIVHFSLNQATTYVGISMQSARCLTNLRTIQYC